METADEVEQKVFLSAERGRRGENDFIYSTRRGSLSFSTFRVLSSPPRLLHARGSP